MNRTSRSRPACCSRRQQLRCQHPKPQLSFAGSQPTAAHGMKMVEPVRHPSNNRQWRRHEERSERGDLLFQLAPGYACSYAFGFSENGFDTAKPAAKVLPEFTWAASHNSRPAEFPTYSYDNLATDCSHAALYHLGEGICKTRRICTSIPRWHGAGYAGLSESLGPNTV